MLTAAQSQLREDIQLILCLVSDICAAEIFPFPKQEYVHRKSLYSLYGLDEKPEEQAKKSQCFQKVFMFW